MSEVNKSLREGQIKFGYDFGTVSEVTHLFGMSATRLPFHNCFKIPGAENTIGCMLSEEGGEGWSNAREFGLKKDDRGWREILTIRESNSNLELITAHVKQEIETPLTRVVFWRESRDGVQWYKFYGVFEIDAEASLETLGTDHPCCIYRKAANEFGCQKVEVEVKEISDAAFGKLAGATLECRLFDDVRCCEKDGEGGKEGSFRVQPGMRFKVKSVVGDLAVCEMDGHDFVAEYLLPKRDIELGYFNLSAYERCFESGNNKSE